MNYQLKKIKLAGGEETRRFEATIIKDGRPIATVSNDGRGGCHRYFFRDRTEEKAFYGWASKQVKEAGEDKFTMSDGTVHTFRHELEDHWVDNRIDDREEEKQIKRWCRTKTVYRLKGDPKGEYRTIKGKLDDETERWLKDQYGDRIEKIYR